MNKRQQTIIDITKKPEPQEQGMRLGEWRKEVEKTLELIGHTIDHDISKILFNLDERLKLLESKSETEKSNIITDIGDL